MPPALTTPTTPWPELLGSVLTRLEPAPAPRTATAEARVQVRRLQSWDRLGLSIRLAYNAGRADLVRIWLRFGEQLARDGGLSEPAMLMRTLDLLWRTADDEALPWSWRLVCVAHSARPLARLCCLLAPRDGTLAAALHEATHGLQQRLETLPRPAR